MTTSSGSPRTSTSAPRSSPSSNRDATDAPAAVARGGGSGVQPSVPEVAGGGGKAAAGTLILGVDPGSRFTGYGLLRLDRGRVSYERSGVIAPRGAQSFSDRLLAVYEGLLALLDEVRPDEVAVESAFVRKSALAALQIGHVRGVILLAARQRGASIHEYTAPEVKLAVVSHGAAQKDQVGFMVRRLLPEAGVLREDEADALAVALCHAHRAPARAAITAADLLAAAAPRRGRSRARAPRWPLGGTR